MSGKGVKINNNMDSKKIAIDFLNQNEEEMVKGLAMLEVDYRSATSLSMMKPKDDKLNARLLQGKEQREIVGTKLRNLRGIR